MMHLGGCWQVAARAHTDGSMLQVWPPGNPTLDLMLRICAGLRWLAERSVPAGTSLAACRPAACTGGRCAETIWPLSQHMGPLTLSVGYLCVYLAVEGDNMPPCHGGTG
jgi:hypothetical protein